MTRSRCRLSIRGIGIAEEQQQLLFNKFIQLDNSNARQRGGTGLGLAICKELIERMPRRVGVRSKASAGATSGSACRCARPY
ncbi:ATP-binding protein [Halopseudomonas pachastrellae]|nr:ATP-binding protein [Halopseudomonas pachastrellae]